MADVVLTGLDLRGQCERGFKILVWFTWICCWRVDFCLCSLSFVLIGHEFLLWIFRCLFIDLSIRFRSATSACASQSISYAWRASLLGLLCSDKQHNDRRERIVVNKCLINVLHHV